MNRSICRPWFETTSLVVLMTGSFSIAQERSDGAGTAPLTALPGAPDPDSTSPAETRFRMSHCTPEKEKNSGPPA